MINKIFFPRIQKFTANWLGVILGAILFLTACIHRLQIEKVGYTTSPLIGIEIPTTMLLIVVTFLYHPGNAVVLFRKKRTAEAVIMVASALLGLGLLIAAIYVDAPTLIYMT